MNLIISVRSEILKTKRTAAFYLTIIAAALVPFIFLMDVIFDGILPENRKDAFNAFIRESFGFLSVLIFPMFVILVCTLLPQIEFRNNTWKQVFASPRTMKDIFISRFLNVHLLILLFLVSFNLFMFMVSIAIHFIDPETDLLSWPLDGMALWNYNVNIYVAILAMSAIQFWVGLRFRNFIPPIAIGFAMWFTGTMMVMEFHTSNAHFFPYTYLVLSFFPKNRELLPTTQLFSLVYMLLFLALGFIDFKRSKMR
jgi:hypothetical protein